MARTNWKNLPSKETPVIAENLKEDYDDLDNNKIDKSKGIEFYPAWSLPTNDANDLPTGIYLNSNILNTPNQYSSILICLRCSQDRAIQLFFPLGAVAMYFRCLNGTSWSSWKNITAS